jgi:glycogen(starch) synthase
VRLLHLTELYRPSIGGVEVLTEQVLVALRRRGHAVAVATSQPPGADLPEVEDLDGVPVHRFAFGDALAGRDPARVLGVRRAVAALKRRFGPDIVQVSLSDASAFFHLRTLGTERTVVALRVAPAGLSAGPGTLLGALLDRADRVTANSAAVGADLRRLAPGLDGRLRVIRNGFPLPAAEPPPPPCTPSVVCLGRVVADKGFDVAVEAWPAVVAAVPDARLTIAGDGPARAGLEQRAAALGLDVAFPGWVAPGDVPALLGAHSAVCVPSRWREAFGLVALQGAQARRPVVATRVGGLPEVVLDEHTGLLVAPEDPDALAVALVRVLRDSTLAARLGAAGRRRAAEDFSLAAHVDAYERLYEELAR